MLTKIALVLALCLCLYTASRLFSRRSSERTHCGLDELVDLVARRLATMRQGAILRATHEVNAAREFCFLKGEDTGTSRQNVLFALIEPEGSDMRFDRAVAALTLAGIQLEVRLSRTRSESARVLAVHMHGTPDQLASDTRRIVSAIVSDGGAADGSVFDVAILGKGDRAIRRRVESAQAAPVRAALKTRRASEL